MIPFKKFLSARLSFAFSTSVFLLLLASSIAFAGWFSSDYYAILQVTFSDSSLEKILIQRTDSKKKCENALHDFWTGARTTCSGCKLEDSYCTTTIPPAIKDIFDNKQSIFPYVAVEKTRVIFAGVPIEEGNQLCQEQANIFINKLHQQARCIRGGR